MRNTIILLFIGFCILISCNDDSKEYLVGEDFINLDSKLVLIDTLTLLTATIQSDSIITSGTNRILIGAIKDHEFGDLKSQSYFTLAPKEFYIDENSIYDSIALILRYDRYYYGDTINPLSYNVHEIIDDFEPKDKDQTQFYNTSYLNFKDEILGEKSFIPYPNKKDSINIILNHSFGENIFKKIQNKTIENINDLEKIFKGITIIPNKTSNNVLGFKTRINSELGASVIRMYYTLDDGLNSDNDRFIDFEIREIFNNISNNKSSTLLSPITDSEYILPSIDTNNQMYIQAGTSLNMRLEVPFIRDLTSLESENGGTVMNATLKMYPNPDNHGSKISAIDSLKVLIIDNKNRIIKQVIGPDGNPLYATLKSYDEELNFDYYYSADITSFIEEIQTSTYLTNYALLFQMPNNNKSVDKLSIYDSASNKESRMKIELIYLLY
ncbi:DUF4270 family protein [uncultured Lutibacter sp.]|uniref:DUF4270 family protein n=1 Tax=uncultured Lutibacter sp. TaxID=437739 RepID=UPI002627E681|nr:DUF4270 family protein [uncultured Lutibacter sp.]